MKNPDSEQIEAVESGGSVAVIAGPGSGKTFCLVEKAFYESKRNTQKIIALTFTRNAAQEIRNRAPGIDSHTIHSFCYYHAGRFTDYETLLDDFILLPGKPEYDLVLVDEFQDLNPKELKVILSVAKNRIFFVGDSNQAIFGYCDCDGSSIKRTKIKKLYLRNNYRSSLNIVNKLEKLNPIGLKSVYSMGNPKIKATAVLFRTNHQMDAVALKLKELEYSFQIRKRGFAYPGEVIGIPPEAKNLVLSTIHCAKGMEWENVVTFDWGYRRIEKNLFYVAVSRAAKDFKLIRNFGELIPCL